MDYSQVLIKPVVSEKATFLTEGSNTYAFFVSVRSNKQEIRKAVERLFAVDVVNIRIIRHRPSIKYKQGRKRGSVSGYKKAYITLKEGDNLSFFDGV
ncbi:MAG: 50S ribosomal protein L23 [Desulfovibrionaceae bacterium]